MGFFEEFEKSIFILPVLALFVGVAFGLLGLFGGIVASVTLGVEIFKALKLGLLGGFVFGGAVGVFAVLSYLFKKVNKT